jgi:hypothetical protein
MSASRDLVGAEAELAARKMSARVVERMVGRMLVLILPVVARGEGVLYILDHRSFLYLRP